MTTISNWDDYEKLLHHTFYNELRIAPEETPTVLTIAPRIPRKKLEKMTQIMFETFSVPCLTYIHQATACVVASGNYSGLVVLMGHLNVYIVPVHQLRALDEAAIKIPIGGLHITEHLMKPLDLTTTAEREIARDIKEKLTFVSLAYENDSTNPSKHAIDYEMPDGLMKQLSAIRFEAPEIYFKPSLAGLDVPTLPEAIATVISNCDFALRKKMASNIILGGGSSLFPNMVERLTSELKKSPYLYDLDVKVRAPEGRYGPWIGASIFTSLSNYPQALWISKEDYDQEGPSVAHKFYNYPTSD